SALGHKRTHALQKAMSALPPKADIGLFDHLIRLREQTLWHSYADCSRCCQIDDQLELSRLYDRHVGWFLAPENTTCINADLSVPNELARAIAYKTANFDKCAIKMDSRKQVTRCKRR